MSGATTAASAVYDIDGRRFEAGTPAFTEAIAAAHIARRRPRCMCRQQGVEMYIARLGEGHIVKRMPDTGSHHAAGCASYEPPAEFSGLGQVLGTAITEDPATGVTTLKLDFPLATAQGGSSKPPNGSEPGSASSTGAKLSLRGLLHYLWDQAELTRWHPGFAGKRTWATVRRHLLDATDRKIAKGHPLASQIYIPEMFSVEQREAIAARRVGRWAQTVSAPGKPQTLMLLIGELKEIAPARFGFKAVVKHLPDQVFAIDEPLYRQLGRRFAPELALWGASEHLHMILVATFGVSLKGIATIRELCLMPVTRQWIPVDDGFDWQLVDRLVRERRCFVKGMPYNLGPSERIASAVLTDCGDVVPLLCVLPAGRDEATFGEETRDTEAPMWRWRPSEEAMPDFPPPAD